MPSRLGAAAGIAGPVVFTGAWIVASLRQTGHSVVAVQLSGLAAPDAREPGIMVAGFVALGACSIAFGGSLHRALGGSGRPAFSPRPAGLGARAGAQRPRWRRSGPRRPDLGPRQPVLGLRRPDLGPRRPDLAPRRAGLGPPRPDLAPRRAGLGPLRPDPGPRRAGLGPRLVQWAGALTIAAGLLRRDHMMLEPPGASAGESWHNHAHDLVSSIIYVTLVVAPLLLALRFRGDQRWHRLSVPLLAGPAATAGLLGVFASSAWQSWDPVLQRVAVTIPLAMVAAVAVRLLTVAPAGAGSRALGWPHERAEST